MSESSGPLLESCTKETLDDLHNCQTLANVGSSFFMSVVKKVSKKGETSIKKRKTPMLVPSEDILFHKEAHKHWVIKIATSRKAEAEAIRYAATIVAREESDHLVMHVMIEYDDRLREAERNNKKLLTKAVHLKSQTMERLIRQNGENKEAAVHELLCSQAFHSAIRPHCTWKVHFEKRKWMAVLECYDNGSIIQKYREEIDEYRQKGETFILAVDLNNEQESHNEASVDEQTQQGEDDLRDPEDGGGTHSDIVKGSTSNEDD
ncbi:myosin-10-like [Pyrus ussuriensis x Pyrus communis]|uniref:Myosin-10-like n=1 Tax=Pyrus ussuriensis x Pyrus communis TaxID=2448454 RepID=A0A5N5F6Q7_9ROSA|nr:myosin-10-like [Pyrus ussuriensis x Pyrus communis]